MSIDAKANEEHELRQLHEELLAIYEDLLDGMHPFEIANAADEFAARARSSRAHALSAQFRALAARADAEGRRPGRRVESGE